MELAAVCSGKTEKKMKVLNCDVETGVCTPASLMGESDLLDSLKRNELSIIYVEILCVLGVMVLLWS